MWGIFKNSSSSSSASYLTYVALLTQTGVNDPVPTILENTLGGVPVWVRGTNGIYTCTLSGAFPLISTFIICGTNANGGSDFLYSIQSSGAPNSFILYTRTSDTNTLADGLLTYNPIEIRTYN